MFNNPFSFQKSGAGYPAGLPSGAVVVYDFNDTNSFTAGNTTVYDLSGNSFNGSLLNGVGSGSDGDGTYVTFPNSTSTIDIGGTTDFYSYWDFNPNMFVGVEFKQATVPVSSEVAVATWNPGGGYGTEQFFMMLPQTSTGKTRVGIQIYLDGGSGAAGKLETSSGVGLIPTGSRTSYSFYAIQGQFTSYFDNTVLATTAHGDATRAFYYAALNGGKKVQLGNRFSGENYNGNIYKFIMYNRTLSSTELDDIETWMSS